MTRLYNIRIPINLDTMATVIDIHVNIIPYNANEWHELLTLSNSHKIYFLPGKLIQTISDDIYFDLALFNDHLYATHMDSPTIHVYDRRTWHRLHSISTPCSDSEHPHNLHWHQICVKTDTIKLSCSNRNAIYFLDTLGKLKQLLGPQVSVTESEGEHITEASKLLKPMICQEDDDGAVLVADMINDRMLVLTAEGQWRQVGLNVRLLWPRDAVLLGGRLYVSTWGDNILTMLE